jgi:nitroimidazol reductase NimA-like FMN-containing flavoprotein (pyridoxamine 5'-phosphate oxidase superfamily)
LVTEDASLEELSLEDCYALLRSERVGRIAFTADDQLSIIPVNYRVVESAGQSLGTWLALRTRPGNVIDRAELIVAFEVDHIDPDQHEGWSVLVRGTLHHVDPSAALFRERFDSEPWLAAERDAWLIIDPFAVTGRSLSARADQNWAFPLHAYL